LFKQKLYEKNVKLRLWWERKYLRDVSKLSRYWMSQIRENEKLFSKNKFLQMKWNKGPKNSENKLFMLHNKLKVFW